MFLPKILGAISLTPRQYTGTWYQSSPRKELPCESSYLLSNKGQNPNINKHINLLSYCIIPENHGVTYEKRESPTDNLHSPDECVISSSLFSVYASGGS